MELHGTVQLKNITAQLYNYTALSPKTQHIYKTTEHGRQTVLQNSSLQDSRAQLLLHRKFSTATKHST